MDNYNDWEEIDKKMNGLVTTITYTALFVNDQVYNYTVSLMDEIRKSNLYRHGAKKIANQIEREVEKYNTHVFQLAKKQKEAFAEITQSMEDDVQPHIERYYYTISQIMLNHGVSGEANRIASISSVINMLAQMSRITIDDFYVKLRKQVPLSFNPLDHIRIGKVEYLSDKLSNEVSGKEVRINLNDSKEVVTAFQAISNALLRAETFNKAFEKAG